MKAYKEKDSDSSSWIEQYEDILTHPFAELSHERKQEMEQFEDDIGEDKVQGVLEEAISFLIFFIASNCRPYVLEGEVEKLLNRFYKIISTEWTSVSSLRDSYSNYARAPSPLEKFSIDLAIILNENIFTGAKMAITASWIPRHIRSSTDKFFKKSH